VICEVGVFQVTVQVQAGLRGDNEMVDSGRRGSVRRGFVVRLGGVRRELLRDGAA